MSTDTEEQPTPGVVRLTVDISETVMAVITLAAANWDVSRTEAIRRLISTGWAVEQPQSQFRQLLASYGARMTWWPK